jgi:hypothetical protein
MVRPEVGMHVFWEREMRMACERQKLHCTE